MTTIRVGRAEAGDLTRILRARRSETTTIILEAGDYAIQLCAIIGPVTIVGEAGARHTRIRAQEGELIKVSRTGSVVALRGLTLEDGKSPAGGAIDATGETIVIVEDCIFRRNESSQIKGGAIYATSAVQLTVKRCVFIDNSSECGGAIALSGNARGTIQGSVFHANNAVLGGAILVDELSRATISSCSFFHNQAKHEAGGDDLFVCGTLTSKSSARVVNSIFASRKPIVNNPERPGELTIVHSVVPRGSQENVKFRDGGGVIEAQLDLVEEGEGLWSLRPGSPASGRADVAEIAEGAVDILGRPLVRDGRADPGALAPRI